MRRPCDDGPYIFCSTYPGSPSKSRTKKMAFSWSTTTCTRSCLPAVTEGQSEKYPRVGLKSWLNPLNRVPSDNLTTSFCHAVSLFGALSVDVDPAGGSVSAAAGGLADSRGRSGADRSPLSEVVILSGVS